MAQKINPISFRLGITQVWDYSLQFYGKSFNYYFLILHKYLQIQEFLFKFFRINNFLVNYQEIKISKNKLFLKIYYSYSPYSKKLNNLSFFRKTIKTITKWFNINLSVQFFLKTKKTPTANLIFAYFHELSGKNVSSKKIIWNLCKVLEVHLYSCKFLYFKNGFIKTRLKGFKIRLSGRLDNSKNQMANSVEQTIGSLSLNCMKSYVEYKKEQIYTKSGVCGLQIWLFYELK